MDQGIYVKELKAETFERMVTASDELTVQCVPLPDHVQEYLGGLRRVFSLKEPEAHNGSDPLRATVESVYRWIHQLPPCSLASYKISREAVQLRSHLLKATDPVRLLFVDIPRIVLKMVEEPDDRPWLSAHLYDQVLQGLSGLRQELEAVEAAQLNQVALITRKIFKLVEGGVEGLRQELRRWVSSCPADLREYVDDPQCSGLLERIRSEYETDTKLVESVASLVTGKSLLHWDDTYVKQYELGLLSLHEKLTHTSTLLAKRVGSVHASAPLKERIADPVLWERLERLDDADRELLAYHLLNTTQKGQN